MPPRSEGVARRVTGVLASDAAVAGALHLGGVAGYRAGLLICAAFLVLLGPLSLWAVLRRGANASTWGVVAGVVGLVVTALLGAHAPFSGGALTTQMDHLQLPFFRMTRQTQAGHSWCRPHCPSVTRTYDVPDVGEQSTMVTVGLALVRSGVIADARQLAQISQRPFLRVREQRRLVEVRVSSSPDSRVTGVTIRYIALRP